MANETCDSCDENGNILQQDPQVTPKGCYIFNNSSTIDTFNGLETLNSPKRPELIFKDPYTNQNRMNVGHCLKVCIDFKFDYGALEGGINCRCGHANALQSYIKVDDKNCNIYCTTATLSGNVTYQCGGKEAYTVYKAAIQYYTPPYNVTIEEKLDTIYNIGKHPPIHYKECIEDNGACGKRILGDKCLSTETMTVDKCIDYCREGNYKYAGLEARNQCFCGNAYYGVGRQLSSGSCSASCPGNNSQLCGGSWSLSLYEVPIISSSITTSIPSSTFPPTQSIPPYLSKGLKIGLGVGIPAFINAIVVVTFLFIRRRRSRHDKDDNNDDLHQ